MKEKLIAIEIKSINYNIHLKESQRERTEKNKEKETLKKTTKENFKRCNEETHPMMSLLPEC